MLTGLYFIALCAVAATANFLSDLPKCKRSDPKFDACLKSAIETTLPLLAKGDLDGGIPSLEPIVMSELSVFPVEHYPFEEKYSNIRLYNHSTIKLNDVEATVTDNTFWIKIKGYCPHFYFVGDYEYPNAFLDGVDYSSKGQMSYTHYGYDIVLIMMGRVPDGSKRLSITSSKVNMKADGFNITFVTEDPKISKALSDRLTNNWEEIFTDVGDQFAAFFATAYKDIANAIFSKIDFDELFPKN